MLPVDSFAPPCPTTLLVMPTVMVPSLAARYGEQSADYAD